MTLDNLNASQVAEEFKLDNEFTWTNEPTLTGKSGAVHKFDLVVSSKNDKNVRIAVLGSISDDLVNDITKFNEAVSDCGIQLKALVVDKDLNDIESELAHKYNIAIIDKRRKNGLRSEVLDAKESGYIQKVASAFQINPDAYEIKRDAEEEGISGTKHKVDVLLIPKQKGSKIALVWLGEKDFSNEVMVFNSKSEDLNIPFKGALVSRNLSEKEKKFLEIYNIKPIDIREQIRYSPKVPTNNYPLFGIEEIDEKIGNAVRRGNVYMISGKTGVGKTTASIHFLVNGAKRGEKGAMILTDTRPTEFITNASSFSLGFESYYKSGMIEVMEFSDQIREMKYEILSNRKEERKFITKITTEIRKFVVANNISRLVMDPITPTLVGEDDFINVMLSGLSMPNIITIITSNVRATDVSFFGIEEYYCSGVIKLEFTDANYGTRRMSVLKMRGGSYDSKPFTYKITNDGIVAADEGFVPASDNGESLLRPYRDVA